MLYPKSIQELIESFQKLPGIGEKTAARLALSVLSFDDEDAITFSKSIELVKKNVKECLICHNLTETEKCNICSDVDRNHQLVCVVEEFKDVIAFEKTNSFKGVYHVLGGLISPLNGINPDDINIKTLVDRIKKESVKEIILALKPSIEGETTALYILKIFEGSNVVISRIANGLPIGADIEYLDSLTLKRAIEDRKNLS